MKIMLSIFVSLLLLSCAQAPTPYHLLTDKELAEYNMTVPFAEFVICVEEVRTSSHIRKRFCSTIEDMERDFYASIGILNTLNSGGASTFRQ